MADNVNTLEKGDVYFFYRPKVETEEPKGKGDVQRFYMVLHPEDKNKYRLAVIGKKRLPDPSRHGSGRLWGFIDKIHGKPEKILEDLGEETHQTKTRGKQHQPAARPAGEGKYRILEHGDHTHFVYALELPKERGPVDEALEIDEEASYIIKVKNPEKQQPQTPGLSEEREADLPDNLQKKFNGRKFYDAKPVSFLDHRGVELLLISASENVEDELGLKLQPDDETKASADIFSDLHLDRDRRFTKPLFEGKWG